jgi:hypothetical protein
MITHRLEQRTDEWFQLRVGKLTASQAGKALATTKSGWSVSRLDLCMQLACERITGVSCEIPFNPSLPMQVGLAGEDASVRYYEAFNGAVVDRSVGFLASDDGNYGCSPDGLVTYPTADGHALGVLEVKNPTTKNHVSYMLAGILPPKYLTQVTHAMFVAGPEYKFCDFLSHDSRLPVGLRGFIVREWRDEAKIAAHADAVALFMSEVEDKVRELRSLQQWMTDCGLTQENTP